MLRNLGKYYLIICCKQSSSTHFCHFLATAFVADVLAGSNPMRWAQKRKAPSLGAFSIKWWAMRDVRVRLAPPAPRFVAPLLACYAGKRFAFPQLRTLAGSNPMCWAQKRKAPIAGSLFNQVVGDEGCPRAAGAARSRFGPTALACCAGKRFAFPQLRTLSGSNPSAMGPKTKGPHSWEPINSVVGDEGFEPPALCV